MTALRLVFDLDDTLYPERDFAIGGFRAVSRLLSERYGAADVTEEMTRRLDGGELGRMFPDVLAKVRPGHTPEELGELMQTYASHVPQVRLFADAARALEACTSAGITLGLVTDGQHATQRRKVAALGIAGRFAEIVYTGALGPDRAFHKPHPLGFETIAAAIGSPGDRFVYVGDNPARDFLAPNALGWTTVMVDRPAHRAHRIHKQPVAPPGGEARHVIASLDDLPPLLMA